jgi:hypothetical protein
MRQTFPRGFRTYREPLLFLWTPIVEAVAGRCVWVPAASPGGDDGIKLKSDCAIDDALCQRFMKSALHAAFTRINSARRTCQEEKFFIVGSPGTVQCQDHFEL